MANKKSNKNFHKASSKRQSRIQGHAGYFATRRTQKDGSQR